MTPSRLRILLPYGGTKSAHANESTIGQNMNAACQLMGTGGRGTVLAVLLAALEVGGAAARYL